MWEKAKEIYPDLQEYLKKVGDWFEHPTSLSSSFYNPVTGYTLNNWIQGWGLYIPGTNSYNNWIETIEDLNYYLGYPIEMGPPTPIIKIRKTFEKNGFLVIGKVREVGRGWDHKDIRYQVDYICPLCNKKQTYPGGKSEISSTCGGPKWNFAGTIKHCKDFIDGDCFITEEAYNEYKRFYEHPVYPRY